MKVIGKQGKQRFTSLPQKEKGNIGYTLIGFLFFGWLVVLLMSLGGNKK